MTTLSKFFLAIIFSMTAFAFAQDFQGEATYKSHRKVDLKMDYGQSEVVQKQIEAQLRKQFQQEYTLKFTKIESLYTKNDALAAPSPSASGVQISVIQGSEVHYKNVREKRYATETEIFGKLFLIKDSIQNRKWELSGETKNIGNYTCYKAVFKDSVTQTTFSNDGTLEKIKKEKITTAWYTPEIPTSNGPGDFGGLPGLILEINDGKLTLICSKLVMNPKERFEIKEPKKGKVVNQKAYDEIMKKKQEEMMERMHSRRGDGEHMTIKIGG
jgi:GLPGLI family protein